MGTNKAKIDKSIKKILKGKTVDEAKLSMPEITSTIKSNFILKEIPDETYQSIIGIIGGRISKFHKLDEEEAEEISSDVIKREQWVNEVMELVEENSDSDMSDILLKALRIALGETVKEEKDETFFVEKLLYQIVFLSLENTMQGALESLEDGITITQIRKEFIKPLADKLFEDDVKKNINELVKGKTTIAKVNKEISNKLKNFGGF